MHWHQPYFGYSYLGNLSHVIHLYNWVETDYTARGSIPGYRFRTWCIYLKILYMLFVHWNMHTVKTVEFVWSWGAYLQNRRCEYVPRNSLQPIDHIHALASKDEPSALLFGCQRHQAAPDRRKLLGGVGSAAHGMSLGFKRVIYRSLESKPTSPSQWKRALLKRASDSTISIEIYPWWLEMVKNFEGWGWLILMFADDVSAKKATGRSRLMQHVFFVEMLQWKLYAFHTTMHAMTAVCGVCVCVLNTLHLNLRNIVQLTSTFLRLWTFLHGGPPSSVLHR